MSEELIVDEVKITDVALYFGKAGMVYSCLRGVESGKYYQGKPGKKFSAEDCDEKFELENRSNSLVPCKIGTILKIVRPTAPDFAQPDGLVKVIAIPGSEEAFLQVADREGTKCTFDMFHASVELEATDFTGDFPPIN
jgi:hypothetical protein